MFHRRKDRALQALLRLREAKETARRRGTSSRKRSRDHATAEARQVGIKVSSLKASQRYTRNDALYSTLCLPSVTKPGGTSDPRADRRKYTLATHQHASTWQCCKVRNMYCGEDVVRRFTRNVVGPISRSSTTDPRHTEVGKIERGSDRHARRHKH